MRTDDVPSPIRRSIRDRPASGLDARNGALVGGLLGLSAGLVYRDPLGRDLAPGDRVAMVFFFGTLGSVSGSLLGSLGRDPRALLWPLMAPGALEEPAFPTFFPTPGARSPHP